MRINFSKWYSKACLKSKNEKIEIRWSTLENYCKKDEHNILELAKLFFELPTDESFKSDFVQFYNDDDISFKSEYTREIAVLAGSTLVYLLDNEEYVNEILLAIMSLSLIKKDVIIPEIIKRVKETFINICTEIREAEGKQDKRQISIEVSDDIEKALVQWEDDKDQDNMFRSIVKYIKNLSNNESKLYESLEIYREDSQILSWLIGQWSNDLDKPLNKKLNQSKVALILGKELADFVNIIPGPYPSRICLSRMLSYCKGDKSSKTLIEMVDLLDDNIKDKITEKYNIIDKGVNTPVLLAINKAMETDECEVWKHTFNKCFSISAESIELDVIDWAYQLYLECLLIKCYNGGKSYGY